jgi:antitoxin ParD1/3/4
VSECVRELIRDDRKRKAEERLEGLLLEGLESEESGLTRQDFDDIRKEAPAQLKRLKKKGR